MYVRSIKQTLSSRMPSRSRENNLRWGERLCADAVVATLSGADELTCVPFDWFV